MSLEDESHPQDQSLVAYDFKHPERITKDQLRTFRGIHEKFAQTFGTTLSTLLRTMVQVDLVGVEQMTYHEYMMLKSNPNCMYILGFGELNGNAILAVDPAFTMFVIDRLLGGPGEGYGDPRPITLIEQSVMRRIVERALLQLNETWKQIFELNPKIMNFEINPLFVQIAPATETVILIAFKVQGGSTESSIEICFPYFVLEKVLPELSAQRWNIAAQKPEDITGAPLINRKIRRVDIPVIVMIDTLQLAVEEMMQLQEGDIIRLDRRVHDELDIKIDNQIKYRCRPGTIGSRVAVQVTEVIVSEEEGHSD